MTEYDSTTPTVPARSRTWQTVTDYRAYGESWGTLTHTVTLTRTASGLVAQVNGEACELRRAVNILQGAAEVTLTHEERDPAPIGKARACELHKIMARLGLPSAQHYALAAAALGEWAPLPSLAALTDAEARAVWRHLVSLYPSARALAA